ncbi:hypothetical protein BX666DRAFT_2102796 [Dichotomocladium elegans]|nr:hypothetical protein BX666DRAFT_2102796 [Dichotomocladium elegans]
MSLDSNHKFMTLDFSTASTIPTTLPPQRRIWNLSKLKNPQKIDCYRQTFNETLTACSPNSHTDPQHRTRAVEEIEHLNQAMCEAIYTSLDTVCGRMTQPRTITMEHFWTEEMQNTFDKKEHYYRKWRKAVGVNALHTGSSTKNPSQTSKINTSTQT